MSSDDAAWIDVLPSMALFGPTLLKNLAGVGKKAGQTIGADMAQALGVAGKGAASSIQSTLRLATDKVTVASNTLAKAQRTQATAADTAAAAQRKLSALQESGAASTEQLAAAQAAVAKTQRAEATAADASALATMRLKNAQEDQKLVQDASAVSGNKFVSMLKNSALAVGVVSIALAGVGLKAAANYQEQLTRLVTSAGELPQNLNTVGQGMLQLAGQTGTSATDLANGMYMIESAGYHGANGLTVLKAAAQGAKAENAELATVANAVTDILTDYHLPALQAAGVTSMLVETAAQGKTTFEELAASMSAIAPLASAAHVPLQDMLGDISEMTAHGVSAEQATQNLANAVRSLSNPTSVMTTELAQVGLRSDQLSKNLGKTGLSGAMNEIADAILHHMGPGGQVLLSTFNQSKIAAEDAQKMFTALPASLQKVAKSYEDGKISSRDWTLGLKDLAAPQAALLKQWAAMENNSRGFSSALKTGSTTSQSFTQAMAKATGNATSMNVALLLTGENAAATATKIDAIANATDEAGYNVKGWSAIQGNFNQKVNEAKSALGALLIAIGQKLLPVGIKLVGWIASAATWLTAHFSPAWNFAASVIRGVITVFKDVGDWIQRNATWLEALGIAFSPVIALILAYNAALAVTLIRQAAVTLAMNLWKIATIAWTVATGAASAAMAILDFLMQSSGITLIILAIGALVGIFILLWNKVAGFRAFWQAVWNGIKAAASAIGSWFAGPFVHFFEAVWAGIMVGVHALAAAATWLWNTILHPVFNAISVGARVLFAILFTVVFLPLRLLFLAVGAVASWLWNNAIRPAFQAIGAAAMWLWNNAIHPAFQAIGIVFSWLWNSIVMPIHNALMAAFRAVGAVGQWLWNNVFHPVLTAIGAAFSWLWNNVIMPVHNAEMAAFRAIGAALSAVWNGAIKPALNAIGNAFKWLWDHSIGWLINLVTTHFNQWVQTTKYVDGQIVGILKDIGKWFVWLWDHSIGWLLGKIGDGFSIAVKAIGIAWDKIKGIVAAPINFVISTVYDNGIRWLWNHVIDAVGLKSLELPYASPVKFAGGGVVAGGPGGGVVPGYRPGVDVVPAMVSPGEAWLVPELVQMIGPGNILAANKAASNGRPATTLGFSGGGVIAGPNAASGTKNALNNTAGGSVIQQLLSFVGNAGQDIISLFTNPGGFVRSHLKAGGNLLSAVAAVPGTLIGKFAGWLWQQVSDLKAPQDPGAPGAITAQARALLAQAVALTGAQPAAAWISGMNTLIWRESAWNPNAVNRTDINAKEGHPSEGLAQMIAPTFGAYRLGSLPDDPFNPLANIVASIRYIMSHYHGIQNVQQANPNQPPKGYDTGGWLEPGWTSVYNGLNKREAVVTPDQIESGELGGFGNGPVQIVGTLRVAEDGLNVFVDGKLNKTSAAAGSRVVAAFR